MSAVDVIRMPHAAARWDLVDTYLARRRDVFIARKKWELSGHAHNEHEQYDCLPLSHYIIAHRDAEVLAGVRLLRCDRELANPDGSKPISYMIRDAYLGRIALPPALWGDGEPPTDPATWELTRFLNVSNDPQIAGHLLNIAAQYISANGGKRVLFLSHPALVRVARRHGFPSVAKGPIVGNESGSFLASQCDLV